MADWSPRPTTSHAPVEERRVEEKTVNMSRIDPAPLLEVDGLRVVFPLKDGKRVTAVDGVDLQVEPGEILGLVGESGCGKTVFSLSLLRLVPHPGRIIAGQVRFEGKDLTRLAEEGMRGVRGKQISMIFQDPQSSLNPVHTIGKQLTWVIRLHRHVSNAEAREEAMKLLGLVRLPDPQRSMSAYPHEFSGGMCQRIMIAMALSCRPKLLIADEPTASLDVTVQAQIMDLLLEIREKIGMSILLVSHDLGIIARMCDRIAVMYLGRIVELAKAEDLYSTPKHPYTQALLRSIPVPDPSQRQKIGGLEGDVPSAVDIPTGCRFRTRCEYALKDCKTDDPALLTYFGDDHRVACLLYAATHAVRGREK